MIWLDSVAPNKPTNLQAIQSDNCINLTWKKPDKAIDGDEAFGYAVYRFDSSTKIDLTDTKALKAVFYTKSTTWEDDYIEKAKSYTYIVTSLDRLKNESEASKPFIFKTSKK
jgi:hypothetical protein